MTFEEIDKNTNSDDPEEPEYGWITDDINENTSDWEYLCYVAADNNNNDLDKDKVLNTNGNSWVMAGYFENEPTIIDREVGNCPYGDGAYGITLEESEFGVSYPNESSSQRHLRTAGHNPDDNDADSAFGFSVSLGGIGIGLNAAAYYPSTTLVADSYEDTTWKFDYGLLGESDLPSGYDDSIGVRWDFEGQNPGYITAQFEHDLLFETTRTCSGPETIYTGTPAFTFSDSIEVVDGT